MLLGYFGYVCTYDGLGIFLMVGMTQILHHFQKINGFRYFWFQIITTM